LAVDTKGAIGIGLDLALGLSVLAPAKLFKPIGLTRWKKQTDWICMIYFLLVHVKKSCCQSAFS